MLLLGQDSILKRNSIYGEFLGNAETIFSINYERIISYSDNQKNHSTLGIGISLGSNEFDRTTTYNFPIMLNNFYGKKHNLETGIGYTFHFGTSNLNNPLLPDGYKTNFSSSFIFRIGYRLNTRKGFIFRLAPLVILNKMPPESHCYKFSYSLGISFGKYLNFKKRVIDDAYFE